MDHENRLFAERLVQKLPQIPRPATEREACEVFERVRWGDRPSCLSCRGFRVYQMQKRGTDARSERLLWRCRDCRKQFTVKSGAFTDANLSYLKLWELFFIAGTVPRREIADAFMSACGVERRTAVMATKLVEDLLGDVAVPRKSRTRTRFALTAASVLGVSLLAIWAALPKSLELVDDPLVSVFGIGENAVRVTTEREPGENDVSFQLRHNAVAGELRTQLKDMGNTR